MWPKKYEDIPGFCKSISIKEIASEGYALTPWRYVGLEEEKEDEAGTSTVNCSINNDSRCSREDNNNQFQQNVRQLINQLQEQFRESMRLEQAIKKKVIHGVSLLLHDSSNQ